METILLAIRLNGAILNQMVKYCDSLSPLDAVFGALADPTRRRMVERLARSDRRVGELAALFSISLPAVSKHLSVMEKAGLIRRRRDGRYQNVRLEARRLQSAATWVLRQRRFWEDRLDALAVFLEPPESTKRKPKSPAR